MTATFAGLVPDLDEATYHAHPALSYSTGKHYLRSPAHYLHALNNRKEKKEFDFGHAVHGLVLGTGMGIVEIPESLLASNGAASTKDAKEFIREAREAGQVPLKADVFERVRATSDAVLLNTEARKYLELDGAPEVSLFATDLDTGVDIRGRIDYLPTPVDGHTRPIDLKTTANATPRKIIRAITEFDYDLQASMYRHLINETDGDTVADPMVHIYVEVDPPHGVQVVELEDMGWVIGGDNKLETILTLHAECLKSGQWPGYPSSTHQLLPPMWYLADLGIEEARI